MYGSWDMMRDGLTGGRKKQNIEVGVSPKKAQLSVKKPCPQGTKYSYYP